MDWTTFLQDSYLGPQGQGVVVGAGVIATLLVWYYSRKAKKYRLAAEIAGAAETLEMAEKGRAVLTLRQAEAAVRETEATADAKAQAAQAAQAEAAQAAEVAKAAQAAQAEAAQAAQAAQAALRNAATEVARLLP